MVNKIHFSLITQKNFHLPSVIPGLIILIALSTLAALLHLFSKKPAATFRPHTVQTPVLLDSPTLPQDPHYKNNVQAIINFSSKAPIKSCRGKLIQTESFLSPLNRILPTIDGIFLSAFHEFETAKESIANDFSQLSDALNQEIKLLEGLERIQEVFRGEKSSPYDIQQLDLLYTNRRACIESHCKQYQTLIQSLPKEQQTLVKPVSLSLKDPITTLRLYFPSKSETEIQKAQRLLSEILSSIRARPLIRLYKPISL